MIAMMTQEREEQEEEEMSLRKKDSLPGHTYSFPSPDPAVHDATVILFRNDVIPSSTDSNLLFNGLFVSDSHTVCLAPKIKTASSIVSFVL